MLALATLGDKQRSKNRSGTSCDRQRQQNSAFDMLATYIGSAADLKPWVQGPQINTDGNLRLSYLAGWEINSEIADNLYLQINRIAAHLLELA
jgi:hypothetical protein